MFRLIYNAIQTPDGTVIQSKHVHDWASYRDKNGKVYSVDGGLSYLRRGHEGEKDYKELSLYDDEPHEVQRSVLKWGTRGKNGDEPLRYVPIKLMSTSHIENVLKECSVGKVYRNCMEKELLKRKRPNSLETSAFEYNGTWQKGHTLTFETGDICLHILFEGDEAKIVDIDGNGYEFESFIDENILDSIFVKFAGEFYSLDDILYHAEMSLPDILEEIDTESRSQAAHAKEMSSPYLTGRV